MNTKYVSCAYQLQCNVVFIGKSNLVTLGNIEALFVTPSLPPSPSLREMCGTAPARYLAPEI